MCLEYADSDIATDCESTQLQRGQIFGLRSQILIIYLNIYLFIVGVRLALWVMDNNISLAQRQRALKSVNYPRAKWLLFAVDVILACRQPICTGKPSEWSIADTIIFCSAAPKA